MIDTVFKFWKAACRIVSGRERTAWPIPLLSGDAHRERARRVAGERNISLSNVLHRGHWD